MNKLLLLLFIPFVTFGQDLDFDDIKQIDSEKQYKRVMFENEFVKLDNNDNVLTYAYKYSKSSETAQVFSEFLSIYGLMTFQLFRTYDNSSNPMFTRIFEQVKKECTFGQFTDLFDLEYACYTCPNSNYKGTIGFNRGNAGADFILIFGFK